MPVSPQTGAMNAPAPHHAVAIVPADDLDASQQFYALLGFDLVSDYGDYRILADGRGWHLHLTHSAGWPGDPERNPFGLYLYCEDVDAVAARVPGRILGIGAPHRTPWGTYEFALSDPTGLLVRVGCVLPR